MSKKHKINWLYFLNNKGFLNMGSGEEEEEEEEPDYKELYAQAQEQNRKISEDLENMRLEIFSEDYLKFHDQKTQKQKEPAKKEAPKEKVEDDFENLSKKQIYERAMQDAVNAVRAELNEKETQQKKQRELEYVNMIKEFAKTHDDFETYRSIMYGLSTEPKYEKASLDVLYKAAKQRVADLHKGATEEQKAKSRKASGEKPGGYTGSYKKQDANKSNDQLAAEALDEVKAQLGPLPKA
jgi:hypothetical protein